MTKEEIIGSKEIRKKRIGGSEFASVLDINPYKKRIELVLEKAGVIADTFEGNEATRRGEELENEIIAMFEDETGLSVKDEQKEFTYTAEHCLPLVCHVDGITSNDFVFEAKTTDIKSKTWDNGIPEYYKAQLDFNCVLSGLNGAYIAVGICNKNEIIDFKAYTYVPERNVQQVIDACVKFSEEVEKYKNTGVVNNGKIIKSNFEDHLIVELESINEEISKVKTQIKTYEDRKKYIESLIKQEIGQNSGFETDLYKITMSNRITSPSYDYKISRSGLKIERKEV